MSLMVRRRVLIVGAGSELGRGRPRRMSCPIERDAHPEAF
jgi:hypothetical protein